MTPRRHLAVGVATLGAVAALGVPAGLLWWLLAPRAEVTVGTDGDILPYPISETLFASEGYFGVIAIVAGMLCGYTAYAVQYGLSARHRGDLRLAMLLGLTSGAVLASLLAWQIGVRLDAPGFREAMAAAEPGDVIVAGLELRATSGLLLWPFLAVLQYGVFDAVSLWRRDLGHVAGAADLAAAEEAERENQDPDPEVEAARGSSTAAEGRR